MSNLKKSEIGFSAVEMLLGVLILAVLGFGGYYVYHAQHESDDKTTASSEVAPTPAAKKVAYTASFVSAAKDSVNSGILNVTVKLTNTSADNLTFLSGDITLVTTDGVVKKFGYNGNVTTGFNFASSLTAGTLTLAPQGSTTVIVPFADTPKSAAKTLVINSTEGGKREVAVQ